jgi:hypothetical protein
MMRDPKEAIGGSNKLVELSEGRSPNEGLES